MIILQANELPYPMPLEATCGKCGGPGELYLRPSDNTLSYFSDKCADNDEEALMLVQTVKLGKKLVTVAATHKVSKKDVEAVIPSEDADKESEAA